MLRLGQAKHLHGLQLPLLGQRVGSTRKRVFSAGTLVGGGSCYHRILQRSEIEIISRKDKTNSGRTEDDFTAAASGSGSHESGRRERMSWGCSIAPWANTLWLCHCWQSETGSWDEKPLVCSHRALLCALIAASRSEQAGLLQE